MRWKLRPAGVAVVRRAPYLRVENRLRPGRTYAPGDVARGAPAGGRVDGDAARTWALVDGIGRVRHGAAAAVIRRPPGRSRWCRR
ncbi:hypothetical protein GCM10029978_047300 [Actinoallomurus acanthiterrae]